VHFPPPPGYTIPAAGSIYSVFKEEFPRIEQHQPIQSLFEQIGLRSSQTVPQIQFSTQPEIPRLWFLNVSGNKLIQVQSNRFVSNWRKAAEDHLYPRYDETIRPSFISDFTRFVSFIEKEGIGSPRVNQCEMVYVNYIDSDGDFSSVSKIFPFFSGGVPSPANEPIETLKLNTSHTLMDDQTFLGRLHIQIQSAFKSSSQKPVYELRLTVRGAPLAEGIGGIISFMDMARDKIVSTFDHATSESMHALWKKE